MNNEFFGKRVLITGGSKGIGKATAMQFAQAGAKVGILARTEADLKAAATEIKDKTNVEPLILVADVSNYE